MSRWWHRQAPLRAEALVGRWKLVRVEGEFDVGEGITMVFADDGTASTILRDGAGDQIIPLHYHVTGNTLVTQPMDQTGEERMRAHFEDLGHLVLDYGAARLWFLRVPDEIRSSK